MPKIALHNYSDCYNWTFYPDQSDNDLKKNPAIGIKRETIYITEPIQKRNDVRYAEINLECLKEINVMETAGVTKYDCFGKFLTKHENNYFCQFDFHFKDQHWDINQMVIIHNFFLLEWYMLFCH